MLRCITVGAWNTVGSTFLFMLMQMPQSHQVDTAVMMGLLVAHSMILCDLTRRCVAPTYKIGVTQNVGYNHTGMGH